MNPAGQDPPGLEAPTSASAGSDRLTASGARSGVGGVAEWLGRGLQSPVHRFNSGPRLELDTVGGSGA
jgi:hypothetical protein